MESESLKINSLPSKNFQDGDAPRSTMTFVKCSRKKLSEAQKEKKRQATKAWRIRNKEYLAAYEKAYRAKKSDHYKALYKENKAKNRERAKLQRKIWEKNNPDKKKAYDAAHYRRHSEKIRKNARAYYRTEGAAEKRDANRSNRREQSHFRRVIKYTSSTREERQVIAAWFASIDKKKRVRCYWCSSIIEKGERHIDHIIPLTKGGTHTITNLCVSCASCNLSKQAKALERWNRDILEPVLL